MSQVIDQESRDASASTDLTSAVQRVLANSSEPLTLSKIRAALPSNFRQISLEELADVLRRQVAANVLYQYPKYRSPQDRFWDRPMEVHIANVLRRVLEEGPLAWPQLRRKLPDYAVSQAEVVVQDMVSRGQLYRHPPTGGRSGERFGLAPPNARDYLRRELPALFRKLQQLGFTDAQLREAAMGILQEEEWSEPESEPAREDAGQRTDQPPDTAFAPQGNQGADTTHPHSPQ